jgi:uncharacterized membrane protein HdeD (DUF308 family)
MTIGLARYWCVFLVRGVIAVLFGIMTLIWPVITLMVLVLLFGIYALIHGIFTVYVGVRVRRDGERWWMMILGGLVGIATGVLTFIWPRVTALVLLYFIAAWAIITGVFEVVAAIWLRKMIKGEWFLALGGILTLFFGVLLAILPIPGALAITWLIGIYAMIIGVLLIILAFRVRSLGNKFTREILREY